MKLNLNPFTLKQSRKGIQNIKPADMHKRSKSSLIAVPFASPAPQPGEEFTSISSDELPAVDWSEILGSGEGFTNISIEWSGRPVILQQFDGPRALERFQEHLAVLGHLRDSFVPITWVAGVSKEGASEPFILYNAVAVFKGLRPLVAKSLLRYASISIEKRAPDADQVWSTANNAHNFYRHLAPSEFEEVTASLST